jgi:hypothetical protein
MFYDAAAISKQLNISKVTAYAKLKLPEVKSYLIVQNGKNGVDEKGLEIVKQSLKYNQNNEEELLLPDEAMKEDFIATLKDNIEWLHNQLSVKDEQISVKDEQIEGIKKLFENSQVLQRQEQADNKYVAALPAAIKEHDIELVNTLIRAMENKRFQKDEEDSKKKKGFFKKIFGQ